MQTLSDAWSTIDSLFSLDKVWLELKFRFILATQRSTGTRFRFNKLCNTCLIVGRWTSCNTNRCDCNGSKKKKLWLDLIQHWFYLFHSFNEILTQQHALTVIWMVFRPGWQTRFKYKGRCELLFSPRSITNGVAFADTWTLAGQFVFIWRSSWWKHFNCTSRSDLLIEFINSYNNNFIL